MRKLFCRMMAAAILVCLALSVLAEPVHGVSGTLIENLTTLVDSKIDWSKSEYDSQDELILKFVGYSFGKISKAQLETYLQGITDTMVILQGYAQAAKFNIEDETRIKYALDNHGMLANGLPKYFTENKFSTYARYVLRGFYWAEKYNYQKSKWNVTHAYANFTWAVENSTYPAILYVYGDNSTDMGVAYGPRFYDEAAETMDCFLEFYRLGVTEALDKATDVWNYINNNLWIDTAPVHYKYARAWGGDPLGYECESGGFLQIALKLQYFKPDAGNITRVTTDMVNRYIVDRWLSPQWCNSSHLPTFTCIHHHPDNDQTRLMNTLMAWASIYGNYYNLTTAQRSNVTDMLKGYGSYDAAWKELYSPSAELYNTSTGLFKWRSEQGIEYNESTASAAMLLMFFGIVPDTGALAMALTEMIYEDKFNLFDKDLFSLNIPNKKLRMAVQKPGIINFTYGSVMVSYDFKQRGLYDVTFGASWNSISSVVRVGNLPANRIYFTESFGKTYTFRGPYDEDSGELTGVAVNVTAYYTADLYPEWFTVDEEYVYNTITVPQYFSVDYGTKKREYWLNNSEYDITIYLFNQTLTTYTISFLDLAGALNDYPFVLAKRYINGVLHVIEKRKVDAEDKVVMNLMQEVKYVISVENGDTYTFGDLTMTSQTTIVLTLKGIEFPKETLLTYKYVRIYGLRAFGTPNGNITIIYQDVLTQTNNVTIYINYKNGTNAYNATETADSFSHVWASALNNTDYAVECVINHQRYGVYSWKQYFPCEMTTTPWGLDWLGTLPFNTAYLIPAFLIVFVGGCGTVINAETGAFLMVIVAVIVAYMGWLPISASTLTVAFTLAVLMGVIYAKRKVQT